MTTSTAKFSTGDVAIWTGLSGLFAREVRIVAVRNAYLVTLGQGPEDGKIVYDIADPVVKGIIYGIPGDQLERKGI